MKIFKVIAILLGLVVVLLVGASIGLNSYFGSDKFKNLLLDQTSQTLGVSVKTESFHFSLLDGAVLKGIVVESPKGFSHSNFFEARGFEFHYNPWALLGGKIEITKIVLDQPAIALEQNAEGRSNLPLPASKNESAPSAKSGANDFPALDIRKLGLSSGNVQIIKADGSNAVTVSGINFDSSLNLERGALAAKGDFSVTELALAGLLKINNLRTPLATDGKMLNLSKIQGQTFGGSLDGTGSLDLAKADTLPFTLDLMGTGIDLKALVHDLAKSDSPVSGTVQAKVHAVAPLTDTMNLHANGHVDIKDCVLPSNVVFQLLGTALNLPELTGGKFDLAASDFAIAEKVVTLSNLNLNAPLLKLTGGGRVTFDQNYDLQLVLSLSAQAMEKAPKELQASFTKTPDGQFQTPPFRVYGPSGSLKTTLLEELLKHGLQNKAQDLLNKNAGGLLKKLF